MTALKDSSLAARYRYWCEDHWLLVMLFWVLVGAGIVGLLMLGMNGPLWISIPVSVLLLLSMPAAKIYILLSKRKR